MDKRKLVLGIGINDSPTSVHNTQRINGKQISTWSCQAYKIWVGILTRCYSEKSHKKCPTYIGCSIVNEWISFLNFKSWLESIEHDGLEIDKDILFPGNKVYGQDRCVFISQELNKFLTDHNRARGQWPIGVHYSKSNGKFISQCSNPFTGERGYLGSFDFQDLAHEAWRKKKHEYALAYASIQKDPRVAAALRIRYLPENLNKIGI